MRLHRAAGRCPGFSDSREGYWVAAGPGDTPFLPLLCSPAHLIDGSWLHAAHQPADCTGYLKVCQLDYVGGKCLTVTCRHTSGCWRSVRRGTSGISFITQGTYKVLRLKESVSPWILGRLLWKWAPSQTQQEGDIHCIMGRVGAHSSPVSAPVSPTHGWVRGALLSEKVMTDMIKWKLLCLHHCLPHTHFISSFLAKCIIKAVLKLCSPFHDLAS